MPKPLHSADPTPKSVQFSHFGVLDDGSSSKGAFATSIVTNIVIAILVVVIGSVVKNTIAPPSNKKDVAFIPVKEPPPLPKPPPPKIQPPKIEPPKIEPPKIKMPEPVKLPPEIKPVIVPQPKPVNLSPPAPKKVNPPPAPVKVSLANKAASVPNHDAHPSAVRLGAADNPLKPLTGPAVERVNLGGAGMPGMNASNTGNGPRATAVNMGSGSPRGTDVNGRTGGVVPVNGLARGTPGGTGTGTHGPVAVQIAPPQQAMASVRPPTATSTAAKTNPTVTYKPTPVYSAEAKAMHLEGNVSVRIRVTASGAVQVLGIVHSLGHGLDESARQAAEGTRFKPAVDASGHPVDWEGTVVVSFQLG